MGVLLLSVNKSQASALDFVIGFLIFSSVFLINHYSWNSISVKIDNVLNHYYFSGDVYLAVDNLIKTRGTPINWDESINSTISVGLVDYDNIINYDKLIALKNNYNSLKDLVLPTNNWMIIVKNDTNNITIGDELNNTIIRVERLVIINNSVYNFIFMGGD